MIERIRGTANIGMTPEGVRQVKKSADIIHKAGRLDVVFHSDLERCAQTARIISQATGAETLDLGPKLDPWHLGKFEGMDAEEAKPQIDYFINHPDEIIPGRGIRGDFGESFNGFKSRVLTTLENIEMRYANIPRAVVGNYRTLALASAYVAAGCPLGLDIAKSFMWQSGIYTGEVLLVSFSHPTAHVLTTKYSAGDGFLMVRHGETPWNKPNSDQAGS